MSESQNAIESTDSKNKTGAASTSEWLPEHFRESQEKSAALLQHKMQEAENDRNRAYLASEWINQTGDIVPVSDDTFFAYKDGIYTTDGEQILRERLRPVLQEHYPSVMPKTKDQLLGSGITNRDRFGLADGKVAVKNGLLDLNHVTLRDLQPEDRALWQLPVKYDESAECPRFERFLQEAVPQREEREKLQEYVGYALCSSTKYEKMLLLLGSTDTGKTVFLDTIEHLIGSDNTASVSIQYLSNEKWGVAELEGKPVNIDHDLNQTVIKYPGTVKKLASGNPMKAERKKQQPFKLTPTSKHFFSANQTPERNAEDAAFYNRWLTVMFTQQVPVHEQDTNLVEQLTTDKELSGILNWAVRGYQRLQAQNGFTAARTPEETQTIWQENGDSIDQFIAEHVEFDAASDEIKLDVYETYVEYCQQANEPAKGKREVTSRLKGLDGVMVTQRRRDGSRTRVFAGIRLTNR